MKESLIKKSQLLRNVEYYDMQNIYDDLYNKSKRNYKFKNLMDIISNRNNILLAYRNIKRNSGSKTAGVDGKTIESLESMETEVFVRKISNKLRNYNPKKVKRVYIPKSNGDKRPLGIPCIEDRIIQQCIKQVLEPICEAKFHRHSYGFRPNRSVKHAIARANFLINKTHLHYVVDIDIKGFFDNVNHNKLKKQIWNMGIQDKNLLKVISKILNSEIDGEGIPLKGTPQGGVLSPLLSNIVLNELDWWISDQWETFNTKHNYVRNRKNGTEHHSHKYRAMKTTKLKEMYLVRYADDFKIFCSNYKDAEKIFNATKMWLKERLHLDISNEKSKITNLRRRHSEFLGFQLKAVKKENKYVCMSRMTKKTRKNTQLKIKRQICVIQKNINCKEVRKLNSIILGSHNYFKIATHVNKDFGEIYHTILKTLKNRLRKISENKLVKTLTLEKYYGDYLDNQFFTIQGISIFPIYGIKTEPALSFTQSICNYTEIGRKAIHDKLNGCTIRTIRYLLENSSGNTEYNDNRISLMVGQRGKCYVTGEYLEIDDMECHHKTMKCEGGTDNYDNLVWLKKDVHKLIHAKNEDTIEYYMQRINVDEKSKKRLNILRKRVGNLVIN